jgi:hypothetical protein
MIFAKNELMFDDIRTAMILDLFWKLLEFDPDAPPTDHIKIKTNQEIDP